MAACLETKFVVLDVETNGLNSRRFDLLSISIFRPDTNRIFNRFLPLDLNSDVYTTEFNGITKSMLKGKKPLSQDEVNNIIESFDLKNRTVLMYSNLDAHFMKAYFERNHLSGIESFHFYNFKHDIIGSEFTQGAVTKDNLCRMMGIENVKDVHSGANDCVLEWKLFKAMNGHKWLITNFNVFELNDDYILPASLLVNYANFRYVKSDLPVPRPHTIDEKVFNIDGEAIDKFGGNISGIAIEHLIDAMLDTEEVDSRAFLLNNKRKLRYLGSLPNPYQIIPVKMIDDGTVEAVRKEDEVLIAQVNNATVLLKKQLEPLIDYLRNNVFHGKKVLSQELVINKSANVLALCDLSNEDAAVEIKTFFWPNGYSRFLTQLYYESRGRDSYILVMDWNNEMGCGPAGSINFVLRKVTFDLLSPEEAKIRTPRPLADKTLKIVKYVKSTLPVTIHCQKCGNDFVAKGSNYRVAKCPFCHSNHVHSHHPLTNKRPPVDPNYKLKKYCAKVELATNGHVIVLKYRGSDKPATVKCKRCGHVWTTRADHVIDRPHCPHCGK